MRHQKTIHSESLGSLQSWRVLQSTASIFAAATLVSCAVGPNYHAPQVAVSPSYHTTLLTATNEPSRNLAQWWRVFHDPQLDTLVKKATLANHDVRLAEARVREARAQAGVTRSVLFPSLDAGGSYS